jgi:hypothetical protein
MGGWAANLVLLSDEPILCSRFLPRVLDHWYGRTPVKFKPLLARWKKEAAPAVTAQEYAIRLPLDDAARLHALAELFPGQSLEGIVTDLLHAALDEIAAAMPYEPGPKVISRDDRGDPVYEDVGLTPRFEELTRRHRGSLKRAD